MNYETDIDKHPRRMEKASLFLNNQQCIALSSLAVFKLVGVVKKWAWLSAKFLWTGSSHCHSKGLWFFKY